MTQTISAAVRTIDSVSNPVYSNESNATIDCLVTFSDIGQHPYTAAAHDLTDYGQQLWADLQNGKYGAIGEYIAPVLTPHQVAANAISAGIILTSTGKPSLNGVYSIDLIAQGKLNNVITYVMLNSAFPPASALTLTWHDMDGSPHIFTSVSDFKNFATAFADFVSHVDMYAASNGALGPIPSNAITIP